MSGLGASIAAAAESFSEDVQIRLHRAGEILAKILRRWSAELASTALFSCVVFLNPRLTPAQQSQLLLIISRAMNSFLQRGTLDEQLLRGIVTLAAPDHGTALLLNYLIESLAAGISPKRGESSPPEEEEAEVAKSLVKSYGVDRVVVAAMPPAVRRAVLDSVGCPSGPVCCITLEPLLWPDCTVTVDVVAVVQRGNNRKEHAFLYRGCALYEWLGRRSVPVSPETRSVIRPNEIYRLS